MWDRRMVEAIARSGRRKECFYASTRNRKEFLKSQHIRFPRHSRRGGFIKFALVLQQMPKELERKKKNYEFYVNLLLIKD